MFQEEILVFDSLDLFDWFMAFSFVGYLLSTRYLSSAKNFSLLLVRVCADASYRCADCSQRAKKVSDGWSQCAAPRKWIVFGGFAANH